MLRLLIALFVAAICWGAYKKYTQFQDERAAVSWEKFGDKPEAPPAATPPQPAASASSPGR